MKTAAGILVLATAASASAASCGSCTGCLWTYASGSTCFTTSSKLECDTWGAANGYTWCTGSTTTTAPAATTTKPVATTTKPAATTTKPVATTTKPPTTAPPQPAGTLAVTFKNKCTYNIALYNNTYTQNIAASGSTVRYLPTGFSGMFRNGAGDQATLAEFALDGTNTWYDISIVPPGSGAYGACNSYADCVKYSGHVGFNTPMQIAPASTACPTLTCKSAPCADAYNWPADDSKTKACSQKTPMTVTFCP